MPEKFVPKMNVQQASEKFQNRFRNTKRAGLSPFLREELRQLQAGKCALCGKDLGQERYNAHHLSYDWLCEYDETVSEDRERSRNGRIVHEKVSTPPCARCKGEHPKAFELCTSGKRVVLLHCDCHTQIHEEHPETVGDPEVDKVALALNTVLSGLKEQASSTREFFELCERSGIKHEWRKVPRTGFNSLYYYFESLEDDARTTNNSLLKDFRKSRLDQHYKKARE